LTLIVGVVQTSLDPALIFSDCDPTLVCWSFPSVRDSLLEARTYKSRAMQRVPRDRALCLKWAELRFVME
jgi:hypothetical protein